MTEDTKDSPATDIAANNNANYKSLKDRKIRNKPFTKIVIRRLPPTMTEVTFLEQVSPIPDNDFLYFARPDATLGHCAFSRAYINFINSDDIYLFKDKFDGYIFLDEKGVEYSGVVEYAPFQRVPKKRRKKDPKCGTIESDPAFEEFLESLKESENREPKLEYSYQPNEVQEKKNPSTPLLDFLAARKVEKRAREERRRREADRRKPRVERRGKDDTIKNDSDSPETDIHSEASRSFSRGFSFKERRPCNKHNDCNWSGDRQTFQRSKNKYRLKVNNTPHKIRCQKETEPCNTSCQMQFPALPNRSQNVTDPNGCNIIESQVITMSKICGDISFEEEEIEESDIKKIKQREWEKQSPSKKEDDSSSIKSVSKSIVVENKDSKNIHPKSTPRSRSYREQRKLTEEQRKKPEFDKDTNIKNKDNAEEKGFDKEKKEKDIKSKEVKRYSDCRKEREKPKFMIDKKDEKKTLGQSSTKPFKFNSDIKPFTQLPPIKTEDLNKVIEEMDKNLNKLKIDGHSFDINKSDITDKIVPMVVKKTETKIIEDSREEDEAVDADDQEVEIKKSGEVSDDINTGDELSNDTDSKPRSNSYDDIDDVGSKDDVNLRRYKSLEEKSSDAGDSDKDRLDQSHDLKKERRIRNKDRPSIVIYQPGMGRFSKQRMGKDKEPSSNATATKIDAATAASKDT